jgi:hypothetical protein
MVPPWVPSPDLPPPVPSDADAPPDEGANPAAPATVPAATPPGPLAPPKRFVGTRASLGKFAGGGGQTGMRQSLGRYVRSGYGGSGSATRRFGGTARTAGVLYGALSPTERGQLSLPGGKLDPAVLSGRSANDVMDAVVEAVRPIDGTQDAEASRVAIKEALSELLTKFPDAALLELSEAERMFAVERFVALDVFRRFSLDVGKTIQDKAPTIKAGLARLKEVKDYIKETVSAAFKKVGSTASLTASMVSTLASDALKETFSVFESYAK